MVNADAAAHPGCEEKGEGVKGGVPQQHDVETTARGQTEQPGEQLPTPEATKRGGDLPNKGSVPSAGMPTLRGPAGPRQLLRSLCLITKLLALTCRQLIDNGQMQNSEWRVSRRQTGNHEPPGDASR